MVIKSFYANTVPAVPLTRVAHNPILSRSQIDDQVNRRRVCVLESAHLHVCGFGSNGNPEVYKEKKLVVYCQQSHQHLSVSFLIFGCFDGVRGLANG